MRKFLNDKNVRIALSLGIDREEIIDIVYQGVGEPWQIGPKRGTPLYNDQLAHQYTEYDPDKANELLDAAGLDKRDSEGFRLMPDGQAASPSTSTTPASSSPTGATRWRSSSSSGTTSASI